jgi:hypothetical protein
MRTLLCVAVLVGVAVSPSFAQPTMPACNGDITIVRVSRIKPGGSLDGFMKASAAHLAWYRANKITTNRIVTARVIAIDRAANTAKYSDTEVLQYHINPPQRPANADDAAWKAYVKQYQDNSDIVSEHFTCTPKPGAQ